MFETGVNTDPSDKEDDDREDRFDRTKPPRKLLSILNQRKSLFEMPPPQPPKPMELIIKDAEVKKGREEDEEEDEEDEERDKEEDREAGLTDTPQATEPVESVETIVADAQAQPVKPGARPLAAGEEVPVAPEEMLAAERAHTTESNPHGEVFETFAASRSSETTPDFRLAADISDISKGVAAVIDLLEFAAKGAEAISNPEQAVMRAAAKALTRAAIRGYLGVDRPERYSNEQSAGGQYREAVRAQEERLNAVFQQAEQAVQARGERKIIGADGEEIVLQPGEHLEHSAAGFAYIRGEGGRVANRGIHKEEFYREQQRETLSGSASNQQDSSSSGVPIGGGVAPPFPPITGTGQGGQAIDQQSISNQLNQLQTDLNHRLSSPRKTIREAALNPWLWTAIAVLIIVYLVASLA